MAEVDYFVLYGGISLIVLFIFYFLIQAATRADRQVKNQRAIIDLLEMLAKKEGYTDNEIEVIRRARELK